MPWSGSAGLVCLLLLAGFSQVDAARPRELRPPNPNIVLPPGAADGGNQDWRSKDLGTREFKLQNIYHHGSHKYPHLHRYLDIPSNSHLQVTLDEGETFEDAPRALVARASTTNIQRLKDRRPASIDRLLQHAEAYGEAVELPATAWIVDEVAGPNITDKTTVLTFAKMAANAYSTSPLDSDWKDVKGGFNYTTDFGWQTDGLRGHIFADEKNATIVIALKGTSPAVFDGADTTGNDKLNDNLFGSCCCGQGGQYMWKQVCSCMTDTYSCNNTCLVKSLRERGHYYRAVLELHGNVTERYPEADVWLTGHSLGGVVSSLLGLTQGLPTLTYEAYPDALAASRLGLPVPPGYKIGSHQSRVSTGLYHFGHTADPIYMGVCNTASSFCTIAGYAFEGACHTGQTCIYDTVGDLGWRVGIGTHKINNVIKDVLEKYDTVPGCDTDVECQDCFKWKFYESNGTEPTTSTAITSITSTTTTRTRTETCKTPGWWGCLDESTTSGITSTTTTTTTSTTTSSTSTCKTPGWFGCKDPTTTTTSSRTTKSSPSSVPATETTTASSTTCETPGWFGCNDPTSTSSTAAKPSSAPATTTASATSTPSDASGARRKCARRSWLGTCEVYSKADL